VKDEDLDQKIALFRYGLIADLLPRAPGAPGLYEALREKAEREYQIPGTLRTHVAAETMRGWLRDYRVRGFDALKPKRRSDLGQPRAIPPHVADILVSIKDDNRALSVPLVIRAALDSGEVPAGLELPLSTVHRLLTRAGVMRKLETSTEPKDRRRFSYDKAGELWMSDVMHGPAVLTEGRRKQKAYLIAFIDDATRVVPHAAFALGESTVAFMPVLQQALLRRGIPKRLYVDNGSAYRSQHLALVAARLGITLIHTRARDAAAKGKQERWFRTVRMQLLPRLTRDDLSSLEALNRRLWVYVEREYHQTPHRMLDAQTPLDRWALAADEVRYVGPETDLGDLFLFEAKRKVQKDRTVSLEGYAYEVDATLVGETVTLRYDPARLGRPIQIWHDDHHVHDAKVVDAKSNCFVKRSRPPAPPPTTGLSLTGFERDEEEDR